MKCLTDTLNTESIDSDSVSGDFYEDVIKGLQSPLKHLSSKYFYDKKGDELFQKIMHCQDYYLTRAELDIFKNKTKILADAIAANDNPFDLIELGAGDASKTYYLLKYLSDRNIDFKYVPIDISHNILEILEMNLQRSLPQLKTIPIQGDYFEGLKKSSKTSNNKKILMFLGSNIGNMSIDTSIAFCSQLSLTLSKGDKVVVGFDLKKNPKTILKAYSDKEGITRQFNLNLLDRINRELQGNFNREQFEHYATYDPDSGVCKSYLVSLCKQEVSIGKEIISFLKNETIFMEISQKYSLHDIDKIAKKSGFKAVSFCFDDKKQFVNAIWEVN